MQNLIFYIQTKKDTMLIIMPTFGYQLGWAKFIYYFSVSTYGAYRCTRWSTKMSRQTFVYIFAQYWSIFNFFSTGTLYGRFAI